MSYGILKRSYDSLIKNSNSCSYGGIHGKSCCIYSGGKFKGILQEPSKKSIIKQLHGTLSILLCNTVFWLHFFMDLL